MCYEETRQWAVRHKQELEQETTEGTGTGEKREPPNLMMSLIHDCALGISPVTSYSGVKKRCLCACKVDAIVTPKLIKQHHTSLFVRCFPRSASSALLAGFLL